MIFPFPPDHAAISWARRIAFAVATIALWLTSASLPGPPLTGLESWHTVLVDAHLRGRQFGPEIVFTYGPWAFLSLSGYLPDGLDAKFVWEIAGKLLLSLTLVWLTAPMRGIRRWIFLGALLCGIVFFDNLASVFIALLTLLWLLPESVPWWQRAVAIAWLAFLAHFKFTFCLQATIGMAAAIGTHVAERRFRTAIVVALAFCAAYVAFWVAAGQSLANLPEFWRLSWEITKGYSWAMSLEAEPSALALGLLVAAMAGAQLWQTWRLEPNRLQALGAVAILTVGWFLAWKHGFTRADQHVFAFFFFSFYAGLALTALDSSARRLRWPDVTAPLALVGLLTTSASQLSFGLRTVPDHCRRFPHEFTHLHAWTDRFLHARARVAEAVRDPELAAAVGKGTVDLFNYDQGFLLLNDLNYDPRPVFQSYSAYTPALLEANRCFFASARAPDFIVVRMDSIDARLPSQDDSLALAEIARRYDVALVKPAFVLLRRKTAPSDRPASTRELLKKVSVDFSADVSVPDGHGRDIWMEVDLHPTFLGRLRNFLYHAPSLHGVAIFEDGSTRRFRLIPSTSSVGFFVRPFIETSADLATFVRTNRSRSPHAVRFELSRRSDSWLWRRPFVRFFATADLVHGESDHTEPPR